MDNSNNNLIYDTSCNNICANCKYYKKEKYFNTTTMAFCMYTKQNVYLNSTCLFFTKKEKDSNKKIFNGGYNWSNNRCDY